MKTIATALLALAVLVAAAPASAQTPTTARPAARIEVGGQGSIDRMPDQAVVTFTIVTNDDNATRATSANNAIYNALVAKLHGLGIDAAAVKTVGYDVSFNQRPPQPNPQYQQRFGYVVTRTVSATTSRIDQAGAVVDAGIAAGATAIAGVSFGLRDGRAAYRAALAAAVDDAAAQAQAIAAAAHVRIVRIISISSAPYSPGPRPLQQFSRMSAAASAPVPTDLPPGSLSVTASATVVYEISP